MKIKLLILSITVLCLSAAPAMAAVFGDGGVALQGVLDGITISPNPGDSSVDVTLDDMYDSEDSYWSITSSGGSVSTMVVELAGFAPENIFGVYDMADSSKLVLLFAGANVEGDQALLSIKDDGSVWVNFADSGVDFADNAFGFYLDSSYYATGGLWYSDTALNSDDMDHMYAYQGQNIDTIDLPQVAAGLWTNNDFILAFEDLDKLAPTDADYTDFVVLVESIVPVPGAVLLGILGLGVAGLKLRKYA